jgi:hypothetical protein
MAADFQMTSAERAAELSTTNQPGDPAFTAHDARYALTAQAMTTS